jgi:hypothetical protein
MNDLGNILLNTRRYVAPTPPNGFIWNGVNLTQFLPHGLVSASVTTVSGHNVITMIDSGNSVNNCCLSASAGLIQDGSVISWYSNLPKEVYVFFGTDSTGAGPLWDIGYTSPWFFSLEGWGTSGNWDSIGSPVNHTQASDVISGSIWDLDIGLTFHHFVLTISGGGTTANVSIDGTDWGTLSLDGPLKGPYFGFFQEGNYGSLYIYDLTVVS